jgi:carbohydrate diacid regulator
MLEKYAQEISEYLSAMMGRSIIITDTCGIIIGAPEKERIGEFHPPSVPCIKYKKMSFDDEESARKLGVRYPGSIVPLFFKGNVVGTAAIAGDPQVVLQFSTLVKNQIESMLRERIYASSLQAPQCKINKLVKDMASFDPRIEDHALIPDRAERLGIQLDLPRGVIAIFFANFRGLGLENNPVRLPYKSHRDPLSDEVDYSATHSRVIEILREIFPDPQNIIASVSRDRFVILWRLEESDDENNISATLERAKERCSEISNNLRNGAIETIIGIGHPAKNLYELPLAYTNAWEVVSIAEKLSLAPGIYCFTDMLLKHMLFSMRPNYSLRYLEKQIADSCPASDAQELAETFCVYCECFFSKQKAAEQLHIHRNTLAYRLDRIEEKFGVSMDNFEQIFSLYLTLQMKQLGIAGGAQNETAHQ